MSSKTISFCLVGIFCSLGAGCATESNSRVRVRSAVEAQRSALSACYADALEIDAENTGEMHVALTVDEDGNVDDVIVNERTLRDEDMPVCVASALSNIELTRPPSEKARIAYTLRFRPRD